MITKEEAIKFAVWLRDEDTIENADKWFGYSDEDMFNYFCSNFLSAEKYKSQRISQEIVDKCNSLEDLVEMMVTDKDGKTLNYADVGETKDFLSRYENFKEWMEKELPHLSLEQILYIMDNRVEVVGKVTSWYGYDRLLTALEFEQRKDLI